MPFQEKCEPKLLRTQEMGTPDDPWDVDYEYEDYQEAVSKNKTQTINQANE